MGTEKKNAPKNRKPQSKSKYETHVLPNLDKITKWAKEGATAKEIASKLKIAYSTFRKYLDDGEKGDERYSALSAAYAQACEVPDEEVEAALFRRSVGYTAKVAKTFKVKVTEYDENTGRKIREVEKLVTGYDEVHVPADTNAMIFYLVNRKPDRWQRDPKPEPPAADEGGIIFMPPVSAEVEPDE